MSYFEFIGVAARVFQVDWQMQLLKSNKQLRDLDLKQIWLFHSLKKTSLEFPYHFCSLNDIDS